MTREELLCELFAARLGADDFVYFARRGKDYFWLRLSPDAPVPAALGDAWIYYSGTWPSHDIQCWRAFLDDLLAEMETMAGGGDRCRWPLDDPWPHSH